MTFGSHRSLRQNSYLSLLSLGFRGTAWLRSRRFFFQKFVQRDESNAVILEYNTIAYQLNQLNIPALNGKWGQTSVVNILI